MSRSLIWLRDRQASRSARTPGVSDTACSTRSRRSWGLVQVATAEGPNPSYDRSCRSRSRCAGAAGHGVDDHAPLPVPRPGGVGEDPGPPLIEQPPALLGQGPCHLARLAVGREPALLSHPGQHDPSGRLADAEHVEQRNEALGPGTAAVVAQVITEQVEDHSTRLHLPPCPRGPAHVDRGDPSLGHLDPATIGSDGQSL